MSSSQPLRRPKWSLHCLEPAGSGCGMEERAALPYCGWKAKLTVRFSDGLGGGEIPFLPSPHISYNWDGGKSFCLFVLFSTSGPGTHLSCLNLLLGAEAFRCRSLIWPGLRLSKASWGKKEMLKNIKWEIRLRPIQLSLCDVCRLKMIEVTFVSELQANTKMTQEGGKDAP